MGNFYTNITLKTTDSQRIATTLSQARRTALISPADRGFTVVFDEASEKQDVEVLGSLAIDLSRSCACPAIAVLNHDDDVLMYWLYDRGELVDEYNSDPAYFDDAGEPTPSGGDPTILAETLGVSISPGTLDRVLRTPAADDDAFAFATDRHREFVSALGLPDFAVGTGYTYLEEGEAPPGLEISTLRRV